MRGATGGLYNDHLTHVTLKIWFKTGSFLEENFSLEKNTFADVKCSAMKQFFNNTNNNTIGNYRRSSFNTIATGRNNFSFDDLDNYKLVSIGSKRTMEEEKTLGQSKVKDGGRKGLKIEMIEQRYLPLNVDEYLLASKYPTQSSKVEQVGE